MSDGTIRSGVHPFLEAAADEILWNSLRGVTSQSAKSDILTPWKEQDRRSREVLAVNGVVDPALRRGMYHRVANAARPYLNSRECAAPARKETGVFTDDWVEQKGWEA